ncbi:MAG: MarR family transcriptional regulator [Rhodospirillaceae bacterium]|jgi:DNA-binding MarR family transcriptional regulator|nr:MarR family transcriptional regulator [Rhodospirillaceae bacterium]MBT6117011.1 MarR family transcriptional regulator [Rhodospirillaceae bacterium]
MADQHPGARLLYLREDELRLGLDLLFFVQRDLARDLEGCLYRAGLGHAHHRALHFIGGNPDITVGGLLAILRITKQSLSRVLAELVQADLVRQRPGPNDRRQRLLALTEAGMALEAELFECQRCRVQRAYSDAGPEAVTAFREVLARMADPEESRAPRSGRRPAI